MHGCCASAVGPLGWGLNKEVGGLCLVSHRLWAPSQTKGAILRRFQVVTCLLGVGDNGHRPS